MATWYILWLFGMFFPFWYVVPTKIWQPWRKYRVTEPHTKDTAALFSHEFKIVGKSFLEKSYSFKRKLDDRSFSGTASRLIWMKCRILFFFNHQWLLFPVFLA
jgi:hypothetical protein